MQRLRLVTRLELAVPAIGRRRRRRRQVVDAHPLAQQHLAALAALAAPAALAALAALVALAALAALAALGKPARDEACMLVLRVWLGA